MASTSRTYWTPPANPVVRDRCAVTRERGDPARLESGCPAMACRFESGSRRLRSRRREGASLSRLEQSLPERTVEGSTPSAPMPWCAERSKAASLNLAEGSLFESSNLSGGTAVEAASRSRRPKADSSGRGATVAHAADNGAVDGSNPSVRTAGLGVPVSALPTAPSGRVAQSRERSAHNRMDAGLNPVVPIPTPVGAARGA